MCVFLICIEVYDFCCSLWTGATTFLTTEELTTFGGGEMESVGDRGEGFGIVVIYWRRGSKGQGVVGCWGVLFVYGFFGRGGLVE